MLFSKAQGEALRHPGFSLFRRKAGQLEQIYPLRARLA
jgi:hypothetical protein